MSILEEISENWMSLICFRTVGSIRSVLYC